MSVSLMVVCGVLMVAGVGVGVRYRWPALALVVVLLAVSAVGLNAAVAMLGYHLSKRPIFPEGELQMSTMPDVYRGWERHGVDRALGKEERETLGTDNYLSRVMVETDVESGERVRSGRQVEVHLAYYTGMIDSVPHVPERCNVGGGNTLVRSGVLVPLDLDMTRLVRDTTVDESVHGRIWMARSEHLGGRRLRLPRDVEDVALRVSEFATPDGKSFYAGYFFIANGGVVSNAKDVQKLAFNLHEKYAYFAKVQFTCWTIDEMEGLGEIATALLDEMFADVMRRLPDWVEVVEGRYPVEDAAGDGGGGA